MTRIYSSDPMSPGLKVLAEMWHRSCGDGRVRAVRVYRLHRNRDGSDAEEYLLTRYEGRHRTMGRIAMSALLRVEGQSFERKFTRCGQSPGRKKQTESCYGRRKTERAWMEHVNTRPRPFVTPEQTKTKVSGLLHSKCKRCKAPIEKPHKQWGWYIGDKDFCTYRCMRLWEKEKKLRGGNSYG